MNSTDLAGAGADVSICIANYNGATVLDGCLLSVFSQDADCSIEVVLHDDASTDESLTYVRQNFPRVRVIESSENVGFCVSNNRMARLATGRYLLFLNNDAALRPGSISALLQEAQRAERPIILGLAQYAMHDRSLVDRGYEFDLFMNPLPVFDAKSRQVATATGACLWVPRCIWEATGGFPPWFESVAEDIFLCQAARLLGYPTRVLSAPGFDHWIGKNLGGGKVVDNRLSTTVRRRSLSERNKTMVMLLCFPAWTLTILLPIHMLLLAAEAVFLSLNGTGWRQIRTIYFSLLPCVWTNRRHLIALRQKLRSRRAISDLQYIRRFRLFPHKLRMLLRYGTPTIR